MAKTKKRIKPTREQAQSFNRKLDAFIESGYKHPLNCNCGLCQALAKYVKRNKM